MYKDKDIFGNYQLRGFLLSNFRLFLFPLLFLISFILEARNAIPFPFEPSKTVQCIVEGAKEQAQKKVEYDPSYCKIKYPGGDVPEGKGACSDFVIRAFRKAGVDLQKEVYEHMFYYYNLYSKPGSDCLDFSIEHRRVKNLLVYFKYNSIELPKTSNPKDYEPGDIVVWKIDKNYHIGIVVDIRSKKNRKRFMVAHHSLKKGPQIQDVLFNWKMVGHYRYF